MILNDLFVIAASSGSETPHWKKRIFGLTFGAASLESFIHLERHGRARLRRSRVPLPLRRRFAPVGSFRRGQRSVHNVYKNLQSDFDAGAMKHDIHSRLLRDSRDLGFIHGEDKEWILGASGVKRNTSKITKFASKICPAIWFSIIQKCGRSGVTVVTPTSKYLGV